MTGITSLKPHKVSFHKGIVLKNVFKAKGANFKMCIQTGNERAKREQQYKPAWGEPTMQQCVALPAWPMASEP